MNNDTLTIELNGEVSLSDFSESIRNFKSLIDALSKEIGTSTKIDWMIEDLNSGSALTTIRGYSDDIPSVEKVVQAFSIIGNSLLNKQSIPYSEEISKKALALTKIINGKITSIRFETIFGDSVIASTANEKTTGIIYSYGSIKGTVETVTKRRSHKFILYEQIFDRAIPCYLDEEQEEKMRDAWGKIVTVSGLIGRQPDTGCPVNITNISHIQVHKPTLPGSYRAARGILKLRKRSEDIIRSMRDA
jgi:hypothetical protein